MNNKNLYKLTKSIQDTFNYVNKINGDFEKYRSCESNGITHNDYFRFDRFNRRLFVRNILCQMKSVIDSEQDKFKCEFTDMNHLKKGFGFVFTVYREDYDRFDDNDDLVYEFYRVTDFVSHMFSYIFGSDISISSSLESNDLSFTVEIASEF